MVGMVTPWPLRHFSPPCQRHQSSWERNGSEARHKTPYSGDPNLRDRKSMIPKKYLYYRPIGLVEDFTWVDLHATSRSTQLSLRYSHRRCYSTSPVFAPRSIQEISEFHSPFSKLFRAITVSIVDENPVPIIHTRVFFVAPKYSWDDQSHGLLSGRISPPLSFSPFTILSPNS